MANQPTESRPQSAFNRDLVLSLYLPAILLSLGSGIAAPNLPVYARTFDIGFGTAALVIVVHAWGGIFSTLPTGYMLDRFGRKPVIVLGPALVALTAFLTAFAGSFPELLVFRFLNGFAAQMWFQGRLAMIADTGGMRERGRMISWMYGTQRFGMLFAPVLGGLVGEWNIRVPFILHGLLVLLVLVPIIKLAKESAPRRSAAGEPKEEVGWREVIAEMRKPEILYFLTAQCLANLTRSSVQGIILLYVAFTYDKGPSALGLMQAGNAAISMPMAFITGIIMDRFGRKMTSVPGFIAMSAVALALAIGTEVGMAFPVFVALYWMLGASQGLTLGNMQVMGSDLAPERMRGRFFSFQRLAGELGGALSPTVFSLLAAISYFAAFGGVSFCGLAVGAIVAFKLRDVVRDERRGRGQTQAASGQAGSGP